MRYLLEANADSKFSSANDKLNKFTFFVSIVTGIFMVIQSRLSHSISPMLHIPNILSEV
jgi:hypothetical protein